MIDANQIAAEAAETFGASLRDDPTVFVGFDGAPSWSQLVELCRTTVGDNTRSALARAIGRVSEIIGTEISADLDENGPLADPQAILSEHIANLSVNLAPVIAAQDWQDRVDALREQLGIAIADYPVPDVPRGAIVRYIATDPRLASLVVTAPVEQEADENLVEELETEALNVVPDDVDEPDENFSWDDEPETSAPTAPDVADGFPAQIFTEAGLNDTEAAEALGMSKGYYSQLKSGKREWKGFTGEQAANVRTALEARQAKLTVLNVAVRDLVRG